MGNLVWSDPVFSPNQHPALQPKLPMQDLRESLLTGPKFPSKVWERVDPKAKLLVKTMLALEPDSRPTAVECLA